jgi:hypothetical protein
MAWAGSAFDPKQAAVMTERATFIIAHGQPKGASNK